MNASEIQNLCNRAGYLTSGWINRQLTETWERNLFNLYKLGMVSEAEMWDSLACGWAMGR